MKLIDQNCIVVVEEWLAGFNQALTDKSDAQLNTNLKALFHIDSYWRDALALSWSLQTLTCNEEISRALRAVSSDIRMTDLQIDPDATSPQIVKRAGMDGIEAFIQFQTAVAHCHGIVRLTPDVSQHGIWRAWTLLTAIDELIGFEEMLGLIM